MHYNGGYEDTAFGKKNSMPVDPEEAENRMLSMVERNEKWHLQKQISKLALRLIPIWISLMIDFTKLTWIIIGL